MNEISATVGIPITSIGSRRGRTRAGRSTRSRRCSRCPSTTWSTVRSGPPRALRRQRGAAVDLAVDQDWRLPGGV